MEIKRKEIIELYKSGGAKAIAEKYQCCIPTALKYVKQAAGQTKIKNIAKGFRLGK